MYIVTGMTLDTLTLKVNNLTLHGMSKVQKGRYSWALYSRSDCGEGVNEWLVHSDP